MRPLALAAVMLVALSGCAPMRALPPEPSGEELEALIAVELDLQWQYIGLTPDAPRPTVDRVRVVSLQASGAVYEQCMADAGYESYSQGRAATFGSSNLERLAVFTCIAQYPVAPSAFNLFSKQQLDYLYDHYTTSVIPCLRAAGVRVYEVPSREEFVGESTGQPFSVWSPYGELRDEPVDTYLVLERCRHYPEGFLKQ